MTPDVAIRDQTANDSDDSPADGIQRDHADQQERQHHQRRPALPVALKPRDHHCGSADQQCTGEEHSARLGEPKPVTEPSPIASESGHVRILGQKESHFARVAEMLLDATHCYPSRQSKRRLAGDWQLPRRTSRFSRSVQGSHVARVVEVSFPWRPASPPDPFTATELMSRLNGKKNSQSKSAENW